VTGLSCVEPITAKICRGGDGLGAVEIVIVSSAASLLDGDRVRVDIDVRSGSSLTVRSVAAQLAYPAPAHGTSFEAHLRVGDDADFTWVPEPLVVCAFGRHRTSLTVDLAGTGQVSLRDEVVLGRSGERASDTQLAATVMVRRDGRPLFVDGIDTSRPGAWGPAVLGDARYVGTVVETARIPAPGDGWIRLAHGGAVCRVLDHCVASGRQALASLDLLASGR
jgi:urease accessory protein